VTGSDDGRVRVWSTRHPGFVASIQARSNVCSVTYNPERSNVIAYGSVDHQLYVYDLRNTAEPLRVFAGHK
jgi:E3 ubiquitin-protein ligase RFWD2